uniref:NADH-ubiquinone oxidoreductase chain 3 n=1 Tax=Dorypteryx domestica TaxID=209979 RepID=A0A343QCA2_9NEOP|nr:NADH dehydrogenase subunit 3 [Dorypteryx domestica]ATU07049.1 NADH dehydrogenase subunit 3 [Dorypteryx domestica]
MINLMISSIMTFLVSSIFLLAATILSKKSKEDQEKSSPFECGFNPFNSPRTPFSIRFFLITIVFLIFDVEITLILPLIHNFDNSNLLIWQTVLILFIMILIIGLIFEWKTGSLEWVK